MPVFLAPWFLLAGVAAAVPVALHLLHRRRPQPVPFATLRFLQEAIAKTRRSRHLTNLLALLMRVLIVLLLAAAFSRPKVRFAKFIPRGTRSVFIILDGSASMHFLDGEQSCFDRARDWARELVGSLSEGDRVAVLIPGRANPDLVYPEVSDHEGVISQLAQAEPGFGRADLARTLSDLLARIPEGSAGTDSEIHVFSDFQTSSWNETDMEALGEQFAERRILLFLNRVQPAVPSNVGIEKAAFYPPAILGSGDFQVRVTVRSSRTYRGNNALRMIVDGAEQAKTAFQVLPDQQTRVGVSGKARGNDPYVMGQLELAPDGFDLDNVFRFCLPRRPGIPVLLVDGSARGQEGTREIFFLKHAIQPRGRTRTLFLPEVRDWSGFLSGDIQKFSVIYLCNPPAIGDSAAQKIEAFTRKGGTVVLMPGQHHALEVSLRNIAGLRGLEVTKEVFPQEKTVGIVPSRTPSEVEKKLLSIMPAPSGLVVRQRLVIMDVPPGCSSVFRYADGGAFAVETSLGQGRLWLTSASANRDWSEWPLTPFFVVFQQELIKSSVRRSLSQLTGEVGEAVALEWGEDATELDFRLTYPGGQEKLFRVTRADSDKPIVINGFDQPGFYRLRRGERERMIAINVPSGEADMRYQTPDELSTALRRVSVFQAENWHEHQQNLVNIRQGRPLWPVLLCAAFFLAVTEELFANIRSRASVLPDILRQFIGRGTRSS